MSSTATDRNGYLYGVRWEEDGYVRVLWTLAEAVQRRRDYLQMDPGGSYTVVRCRPGQDAWAAVPAEVIAGLHPAGDAGALIRQAPAQVPQLHPPPVSDRYVPARRD